VFFAQKTPEKGKNESIEASSKQHELAANATG
jgi:hypothetical protein